MTLRDVSHVTNTSSVMGGLVVPKNHVLGVQKHVNLTNDENNEMNSQLQSMKSQLQSPTLNTSAQSSKQYITASGDGLDKSREELKKATAIVTSAREILINDEELPDSEIVAKLKSLFNVQNYLQFSSPKDTGEDIESEILASVQNSSLSRSSNEQIYSNANETILPQETEEEDYGLTNVPESSASRTKKKKKKKAQRRRTLALHGGANLLAKTQQSPSTFFLASTQTDESYEPSSHASSASRLSNDENVSHDVPSMTKQEVARPCTEDVIADDFVLQPALAHSAANANKESTVGSKKNPISKSSPALSSDTPASLYTTASSSGKPPLRRSQRRRTMAFHRDQLLIGRNSTPLSLASVTPPSDRNGSGASTNEHQTIEGKSPAVHFQKGVEALRQKPDTPDTGSSKASVRSNKSLRRSRRNSMRPEKLRDFVGYKPSTPNNHLHHEGVSPKVSSGNPSLTNANVEWDTICRSNLVTTTNSLTVEENDKSSEGGEVGELGPKSKQIIEEPKATIDGSSKSDDTSTAMVHVSKPASTGTPQSHIDLKEASWHVSDSNAHGVQKTRKKRRSSVGLQFTGGLLTPHDFERVMEDSRKRCRRNEKDHNLVDIKKAPFKAESTPNDVSTTNFRERGTMESESPRATEDSNSHMILADDGISGSVTVKKEVGSSFTQGLSLTVVEQVDGADPGGAGIAASRDTKKGILDQVISVETKVIPVIPADVVDRIRFLFKDEDAVRTNCVSSRLFSCFTLVAERWSADSNEAGIRTRRHQCSHLVEPLLPLMRLMVHAELTSLRATPKSNGKMSPPALPRRRVQFCSIECSSTKTPVDSVAGSHVPLENVIQALEAVLTEIQRIFKLKQDETLSEHLFGETKTCLENLIRFLINCEGDTTAYGSERGEHSLDHDDTQAVLEACSKSMPCPWPERRFKYASKAFRVDFERIVSALKSDHCLHPNHLNLDVEKRLADCVGRAIRFYLRKFFNPVPLPLTTNGSADSSVRSRVHEILELTDGDDGGRDTAAADGSVSSVFSTALRQIYSYFHGQNVFEEDFIPKAPTAFLTSTASQRGVGTKRATIIISDEDLDEVLSDIDHAHQFLAMAKACKFLSELMNWPGVKEEIESVGGWESVERYGQMVADLCLEDACPDDSYFVLLRDVETLTKTVERFWNVVEPSVAFCEEGLSLLWKKFRCGTQSKSVLSRNPHIRTIATILREGKENCSFPSLSVPVDESFYDE